MKILFVHAGADISISDVSRGYRTALLNAGHEIADYHVVQRSGYHRRALPDNQKDNVDTVARYATENIPLEAMYHGVDLVIIVSGLNVHPIALWTLNKLGIPTAAIFTESPYDDEVQQLWANTERRGSPNRALLFTNDAYSADRFGWEFLAPAFDPAIHHPVPPVESEACDVLFIGTGWRERQTFLEAVDWTGIKLRIIGPAGAWSQMTPESPLFPYYEPLIVDNRHINQMYCSAKICLNFHRRSGVALTPNPRAYEVAACGAFQLSDPRPGIIDRFGVSVPTFSTPEELGRLIRHHLANDAERIQRAHHAEESVRYDTFDARVHQLMSIALRKLPLPQAVKVEAVGLGALTA